MATKRSAAKKKQGPKKSASPTALAVPQAPLTMSACLAVLGVKGRAAWNIVCSLGPRALALWPTASKNLLNHQVGKDAIAGWKNALDRENADFAEVEKDLIAKIPKARPEELVEIQQKIEFVRGLRCQGNVVGKALAHLAAKPDSTPCLLNPGKESASADNQVGEISDHWTDHFNRFARQRNEPWREQLLARALAEESENPGSISSRLLWILGTLETEKFEYLSALFDVAATIDGTPAVVGNNLWSNRTIFPELGSDGMRFSQIPIALSDVGVLENHDIVVCLNRGERIVASYDGEAYNITCNDLDGRANGILFTSLGRSLAKLYDQTFNDFGRKLFKDWITDLPPSRYSVSKI